MLIPKKHRTVGIMFSLKSMGEEYFGKEWNLAFYSGCHNDSCFRWLIESESTGELMGSSYFKFLFHKFKSIFAISFAFNFKIISNCLGPLDCFPEYKMPDQIEFVISHFFDKQNHFSKHSYKALHLFPVKFC